jgi:hypothetical protein
LNLDYFRYDADLEAEAQWEQEAESAYEKYYDSKTISMTQEDINLSSFSLSVAYKTEWISVAHKTAQNLENILISAQMTVSSVVYKTRAILNMLYWERLEYPIFCIKPYFYTYIPSTQNKAKYWHYDLISSI